MSVFRMIAVSCLIWVSLGSPSAADTATQSVPLDPNQKICETVTSVGSRLATKKVCATRAEWAEKRKQDREVVDQMQRLQGRPCVDAMHGTGAAPAC